MRYLITPFTEPPFLSDHFDFDNDFNYEIGMIVFDLKELKYIDSIGIWQEIEENHL